MGRTVEEIHQEMFAVAQEQSQLTDARETAIANAILKAGAMQIEQAEDKIEAGLAALLGLDAEGDALDDVVGGWPGFEKRRGMSPAQGAALELTRDDTSGALDVDVGSVFATASGQQAVLAVGVTFLDGEDTYPAAGQTHGYLVSSTPGPTGNIEAGALRQVVRAPDGVIGCRNVIALDNGRPRETDAQLRKRFLDYLAGGVSRTTPRGIMAVAQAFRDRGVLHVTVWNDPKRPYAEVCVDNGTGFVGATRTARPSGGTIPAHGQLDFWFDYPVASSEVTLKVNGIGVSPVQWTTLHERGRAWLEESAEIWEPGDTWEVSGHTVLDGLLRDIQATFEGLLAWQGRSAGFRSTAARVRVVIPVLEAVEYDVLVVYAPLADQALVDAQVMATIVQHHINLPQGADLVLLALQGQLDKLRRPDGVVDVILRDPDDPAELMRNVSPSSPRHKLTPGVIKINGS